MLPTKRIMMAKRLGSSDSNGKYLNKIDPENVLFLGISGGNGLEHINTDKVKRVCAIDINDSYLEETRKRFGEKNQAPGSC